MNEDAPLSGIEKSIEHFNSSLSNLEKAYHRISQKIDDYQKHEIVPREYLKEMAGNLAHEIRNPLSIISTMVELLTEQKEDARSIQGILSGVERIDKIVENLIVFSRPLTLKPIESNFCDLLGQAVETTKSELKSSEPRFDFVIATSSVEVFVKTDPVLMLQAIQNILQNAVEIMSDGGTISLKLTQEKKEKQLLLTIADEGPGLSDKNEEKPFYPFFTTKTYGMGLGLPTARLIVEKHGGKAWMERREKGTAVLLNLPLS